jgi:tetratricopeptide (TPR) repeat protein
MSHAYNRILWTVDNELRPSDFERMCTDVLGREGYDGINPIGGSKDRGRDAEERLYSGIGERGVTFFQFTLEERWEPKLKKELASVRRYGHKISSYVFVTRMKVSGAKRDALCQWVDKTYGWTLEILDREWLRHRLEDRYPFIAARYLGIETVPRSQLFDVRPDVPEGHVATVAWEYYRNGDHERASVEFKRYLKENPHDKTAFMALAWSEYRMYRYRDALRTINQALEIAPDDPDALGIKGCVLAEQGISEGKKTMLLMSREIFSQMVEHYGRWVDHYNFANTLGALGEHETAKSEYEAALEKDDRQAEVWKNLGESYFQLKRHDDELRCYDRALAINPNLTEALFSKGVTLLVIRGDSAQALALFRRARAADPELEKRWPHVWYWQARANLGAGNLQAARKDIEKGLQYHPDHHGLLQLKKEVLSQLWELDPKYETEAKAFFKFMIELMPNDFVSFAELMRIYNARGDYKTMWPEIGRVLIGKRQDVSHHVSLTEYNLDDVLRACRFNGAYAKFRSLNPIDSYVAELTEKGIVADPDFVDALSVASAVAFGCSCEAVRSSIEAGKQLSAIDAYGQLAEMFRGPILRLSVKLAGGIRLGKPEETAEDLTGLLLGWAEISLRELTAMFAFLGIVFGYEVEQHEEILLSGEWNPGAWLTTVAAGSLEFVNKRLRVFPNDDDSPDRT